MIPHSFGQVGMSAGGEAAYRVQSAKPPMSHVRKRCGCGAIVTAKQLEQYRRCPTCVKIERISNLAVARLATPMRAAA